MGGMIVGQAPIPSTLAFVLLILFASERSFQVGQVAMVDDCEKILFMLEETTYARSIPYN